MSRIERTDSLLLQTRAKWSIPNDTRLARPDAALRAAVDLIRELFPEARLRSIAGTYNWVGLVVASRTPPSYFIARGDEIRDKISEYDSFFKWFALTPAEELRVRPSHPPPPEIQLPPLVAAFGN